MHEYTAIIFCCLCQDMTPGITWWPGARIWENFISHRTQQGVGGRAQSVSALRYQKRARKSSLQVTKAGPVGEWTMDRTTPLWPVMREKCNEEIRGTWCHSGMQGSSSFLNEKWLVPVIPVSWPNLGSCSNIWSQSQYDLLWVTDSHYRQINVGMIRDLESVVFFFFFFFTWREFLQNNAFSMTVSGK